MVKTAIQDTLYFARWQLYPVILALPAHLSFVLRSFGSTHTSIMTRSKLAWLSIFIHLRVRCGHNPVEALMVMEEIIELPPDRPGVIVECGAYLGGSTAKLSQAVALAGRELIVCDSFEGLPEVGIGNHTNLKVDFTKGEYLGILNQVKSNVARLGKIQCVKFVKGWYKDSLAQLEGIPIACAFWDVDLQESFRACIRALWGSLYPESKVFLHNVDRSPVVEVFTNAGWWKKEMDIDPPRFVGANKGLGRLSPLLGFVVKA